MNGEPAKVAEYAAQAVAYVQRALGLTLEFDSDTLPLLDHYLRNVPQDQTATLELVVVTAGAYFGEVVRRRLGGRWDVTAESAQDWRMILPTGVSFSPAGSKDSYRVLENLMLQRISQVLDENRAPRQWVASGLITEYRGSNYLLVTKAVIKVEEGDSAASR